GAGASGLLEEAGGVVPQQLSRGGAVEALPAKDVVDRIRELAFRMRIVGGVHQQVVTKEPGDIVQHVLAFMVLDAAKKPAARHISPRLWLPRATPPDIPRLLVEAPTPERQPAEAAFEDRHAQRREPVIEPAADKRCDKPHRAPRMGGGAADKDVLPQIQITR